MDMDDHDLDQLRSLASGPKRKARIRKMFAEQGFVTLHEIARILGVSPTSAHHLVHGRLTLQSGVVQSARKFLGLTEEEMRELLVEAARTAAANASRSIARLKLRAMREAAAGTEPRGSNR